MHRPGLRILLVFLVAALAGAVVLAFRAGVIAGRGLPEFSVFSNEPNGLATAASVLSQLGFKPTALTRPIQQTRHRGLLIVVEPTWTETMFGKMPLIERKDCERMLEWVAKGNTLVYLGREHIPLHDLLNVTLKAEPLPQENVPVLVADAAEIAGYTEPAGRRHTLEVRRLALEGKASVSAPKGLPMWMTGADVGAVLIPHERGHVIVIADPALWTHRSLDRRQEDNVLFLYNVAALNAVDKRVYFDELHHGIRSGSGYWDYLRHHGQHWNLLQLVALAAVAVWATGVRLGPAVRLASQSQADAVDYASAVARIYQQAGVHRLLAQTRVRDFQAALTAHLRLPRTALPVQILAAWRQRHGQDVLEHLSQLLRGLGEMRQVAAGKEIDERELLGWSQAFDEFLAAQQLTRKDDVVRDKQ
jgi:hypothetical protein